MHVFANGKSFSVAMHFGDVKYAWDKASGSLILTGGKSATPVNVQTPRGVFVEATSQDGSLIASGGDGNWLWVPVGKATVRLRYKVLPPLALSPAKLNRSRKAVTRYIVNDSPSEAGVPDTLEGLIEWAREHLASVPKGSRATASCRFDTSMSYGDTYAHVEVSYTEPETDEEVITRLQIDAERHRIKDAADRAQLAALQERFSAA